MLVDFNNISDESRIWIYASEKELTNNQKDYILDCMSLYLQTWKAHNKPLTSAVTILEDHFIIIALDESKNVATGCSIDIMQKNIQEIEKDLSIYLMNRLNIFCKIDLNDKIVCVSTNKLRDKVRENTLFYDLTIQKKHELLTWCKPIKEGWCKRFL